MGTFQLGRIGLENTSGEVQGWSSGGSGIRVSGHTEWGGESSLSVAEALVVREQLLGYVEQADEDFVPVTWSEQPEVNGFYRVASVSVDSVPERAPFGVLDWSVDLVRVQGFASALVEVSQLGAGRVDETSWATVTRGFGLPGDARSGVENYRDPVRQRFSLLTRFLRPSDDGVVMGCEARTDGSIVEYYVDPGSFYQGAATLRVGDPARIAVGQQTQNTPTLWSLSNGLLQVRPHDEFAAGFVVEYRMWLSGAWTVWETAEFRFGGVVMPAPHTIRVLRNSPEDVRLRFMTVVPDSTVPVTVDFGLRRGSRYVDGLFASLTRNTTIAFSNFSSPTVLGTTGFSKTVSGVTKFAASTVDTNNPPTGFGPVVISEPSWHFCFGLTDGQVAGAWTDDAARSISEWFWAGSERQSVVTQ